MDPAFDNDDEDDSMAANPEPPRVDAGYAAANPHRRTNTNEKHGKWVMQFVPEDPRRPEPRPQAKHCRKCNAEVAILHSVGNSINRTVCGKCQGEFNAGLWQP